MVSSSKPQQRTVCSDTLQRLVLDHLQHLDKRLQPTSADAATANEAALAAIRQAVVDGDISGAIDVTNAIDPSLLLEHPTLLFELKLQAWVELLRNNRTSPNALSWLRTELAPLALGAHPETYQRFQAALPLLLSCADGTSDGAQLDAHWSLRRRLNLASQLELTLRVKHNLFGSALEWYALVLYTSRYTSCYTCSVLRYLLLLARQYRSETGPNPNDGPPALTNPATHHLVHALLRPQRDPPLAPPEGTSCATQEVVVQALAQVLGYGRHETIGLLRCTGGDVPRALRLGLHTLHVDQELLHATLLEHAAVHLVRGLLCSHVRVGWRVGWRVAVQLCIQLCIPLCEQCIVIPCTPCSMIHYARLTVCSRPTAPWWNRWLSACLAISGRGDGRPWPTQW